MLAFSCPLIVGTPLHIITKKQSNRKLNDLINKYRSLSGNVMIETGASLKEAIKVTKQKKPICFLIDQAGHPDYSVYVDFFGRKVATFAGPAKLALAERPLLQSIFIVRGNDFKYRVHSSMIDYDDLTDKSKENVEILSQRIQSKIEEAVKRHPEQWLWFHKRFKHMRQ